MDIILKHRGNYKALLTFKKATVIYDLTYFFATHYLSSKDRTVDQMIQAARSGKQNIAEGVAASSTNAETEIKLINVAKASLKELLTDYEDYIRTRRLTFWQKGSKEFEWVRQKASEEQESTFWLDIAEKRDDQVLANIAIIMLKQEDYLLFKQLEALEGQLKSGGDLHSRIKAEESSSEIEQYRKAQQEANEWGLPRCPKCHKVMTEGMNRGQDIRWYCPECNEEKLIDFFESLDIRRERNRKITEVKMRFDRLLKKIGPSWPRR